MSYWKPKGTSAPNGDRKIEATEEKPVLSKSVMAMKFMQKKQTDNTEITAVVVPTTKASSKAPTSKDSVEIRWERDKTSISFPGRRSFGGCNRFIERHYEKSLEDQYNIKLSEREEKNTISEEDMLKRYEELVSLPRGPNQGMKKHRNAPADSTNDSKFFKEKSKKKRNREEDNIPMKELSASGRATKNGGKKMKL